VLTFEQLREIHRRERASPSVLSMNENFWKEVSELFTEKMTRYYELRQNTSRFTDKVLTKFENEFRNIARVIVEIYTLREKKILTLAWSEVASDEKIDLRSLTSEERELFSKTVNLLKSARKDILQKAISGDEIPKEQASEPKKAPETLKLSITEDVSSFMGTDMNFYGPYTAGEVVELPEKLAKLLVEKGKAKEHQNA
jgi:DNA replication initiation complex subunit (GINS family)